MTRICVHAGSLFTDSLRAEMAKHPELADLGAADAAVNAPEILFGARRKGYFKAKHLCRVLVLDLIKGSRVRGEYFVVWEARDGGTYDGRHTLAHYATIKYTDSHEPGLSVAFDKNGALKSTSTIFNQIRR